MASAEEVKKYLAYWFQLGKGVVLGGGKEIILPQPIFRGTSYSKEFEDCWQRLIAPDSHDCYLEGTIQTVEQLLAPSWDIASCARCEMPIPMVKLGIQDMSCPCNDLPLWPNTEIPHPRGSVDRKRGIKGIRDRLLAKLSPEMESSANSPDASVLRKSKSHKQVSYWEKLSAPPLTSHLSATHSQEHNED
jgi:hypothetical protein